MRLLRPDQEDREEFVRRIDAVQRPQGYRLVGAFEPGGEEAMAAAGFRTGTSLAWGSYLYVDDLSTLAEGRRRGHAGALLEWLTEEARRLGCDSLHLDSGFGPTREDAHRLYLNSGLAVYALHFARRL
jgi:GNAT superfamily N-acetyltransferase